VPGQAFTIEPVLVEAGGVARVRIWPDEWTAVSWDGSLSAQFEVTVIVRAPELGGGCEVVTPFAWKESAMPARSTYQHDRTGAAPDDTGGDETAATVMEQPADSRGRDAASEL
jgi:hypothetical protein